MRAGAWLDPTGSARARLGGAAGGAGPVAGLSPRVVEAATRLDLGEGQLWLAHELARAVGEDRLPWMHLLLASLVHLTRGSTRLAVTPGARRALHALLAELAVDEGARGEVDRLLDDLTAEPAQFGPWVGGPGAYAPLILESGHLYHQKAWELERRVAERLRARLTADRLGRRAGPVVADVQAEPPRIGGRPMKLSAEQRAALELALDAPMTIVSGGPGTGKTSIVVSLLRALVRVGDPGLEAVALAAPTGRAADRMRQSVTRALAQLTEPALADRALLGAVPEALTLHRLLGYSPRSDRFRHHERNRLAHRFVIVDESSMVDLGLMDRLLRALADDAQLLLLGDARQLPSVDAGAVFRDLCAHAGDRAVELTRSYRMDPSDPSGKNILSVAARMDAGDAAGLFEPGKGSRGDRSEVVAARADPAAVAFDKVELIEPATARGREQVLDRWARWWRGGLADRGELVARRWPVGQGPLGPDDARDLDRLLEHYERFRVLCLTQGRATGVEAVNRWFHAAASPEGAAAAGPVHPVPGEPVIVLRNDYERKLFNGDQGLVLRGEGGPVAVFRREGGFVAFPLEAVRSLIDAAWAITVHKSQGSEYDHVMVVLPDRPTALLTRELLYTAVTRSRKSVLLVGPRAMLAQGIQAQLDRSTGLAERL